VKAERNEMGQALSVLAATDEVFTNEGIRHDCLKQMLLSGASLFATAGSAKAGAEVHSGVSCPVDDRFAANRDQSNPDHSSVQLLPIQRHHHEQK
jgi:hypothetical protein